MKKLLIKLMATATLALGFGVNADIEAEAATAKTIGIKQDNAGYVVLNQKTNTIACKVTEVTTKFSKCQNVFDDEDQIWLNGKKKKNSILLVDFDNDDAVNIRENTLNIANKVIGQKVNPNVDVYVYKVTSIGKYTLEGVAVSDKSWENEGVHLSKKYINDRVRVGDKLLVTFNKGVHDDIKKVQKIY